MGVLHPLNSSFVIKPEFDLRDPKKQENNINISSVKESPGYKSAKEPYVSTKEPYTSANEPYRSAKEPLHVCIIL